MIQVGQMLWWPFAPLRSVTVTVVDHGLATVDLRRLSPPAGCAAVLSNPWMGPTDIHLALPG
jgi:hypothetical protein